MKLSKILFTELNNYGSFWEIIFCGTFLYHLLLSNQHMVYIYEKFMFRRCAEYNIFHKEYKDILQNIKLSHISIKFCGTYLRYIIIGNNSFSWDVHSSKINAAKIRWWAEMHHQLDFYIVIKAVKQIFNFNLKYFFTFIIEHDYYWRNKLFMKTLRKSDLKLQPILFLLISI